MMSARYRCRSRIDEERDDPDADGDEDPVDDVGEDPRAVARELDARRGTRGAGGVALPVGGRGRRAAGTAGTGATGGGAAGARTGGGGGGRPRRGVGRPRGGRWLRSMDDLPRRSAGRPMGVRPAPAPQSYRRPMYGRSTSGTVDGAVGLLVVLEDRGDDPRQREPGAVERVDELRLGARLGAVADRHPARLVVAEVRARADLEPALDARRPDLEVVLLALDEAHARRCHQEHPVRQPEPLEQDLGARRSSTRAPSGLSSGFSNSTISTLSNWWTRRMPRVSLPAAPASRRKHGE